MNIEITPETKSKVEQYVYKNYSKFEGKQLTIKENSSCFLVSPHKDKSPLILSKSILK
jgi:hypothetical protein